MKKLYILLLIVMIISCGENDKSTPSDTSTVVSSDSLAWIDQFREFRDAVYKGDKTKVKQFIDFPIMNENNEVWDFVTVGNDSNLNLSNDQITPFTEKDFDKYFNKLFSKRFVTAILKIKSAELNKKEHFDTPLFDENDSTTYYMSASYDRQEGRLVLNVNSTTAWKDEKGEVMDGGESSVIYQFDITKEGKLKFRQLRMAG
jgi:hypothetical protein